VLQYPTAAASAVILTIVMISTIAMMILRAIDVRKEIAR
jgi:putative spermidine/putrescine transport system permease protein